MRIPWISAPRRNRTALEQNGETEAQREKESSVSNLPEDSIYDHSGKADGHKVAALIDYDNITANSDESDAQVAILLNRILGHAMTVAPDCTSITVRLYGGWLEEGILTKRASILQTGLGSISPFPMAHPNRAGILRGRIELATRLAESGPSLLWAHTLKRRQGLPRVSLAERPHPQGCRHESNQCPVVSLQRFARKPTRTCPTDGCDVTNQRAFSVPEQKMVDVLIACDSITYAQSGHSLLIASSDLDLLPAVVLASSYSAGPVGLLRSEADSSDLYDREMESLGIDLRPWVPA